MADGARPPLRITPLRTSCLLVEAGGFRLLTDPWFGKTMRGLPVFRSPGVPLERVGRLDAIVASHLHRDHYDRDAVAHLAHPGLHIFGTRGTRAFTGPADVAAIHDLAPWEAAACGPLTATATPAEHTGPPPPEVNFILDLFGWRVFFGGDARYSDAFAQIGARFDAIDVALLPIGGTLIFGHRTTMDPADAVRACGELRPTYAVPIHEGGEWLPVPPASWHPGRCRHFVQQLGASPQATMPVAPKPGATATFTDDGVSLGPYTPAEAAA